MGGEFNLDKKLPEKGIKPRVRLWHSGGIGLIIPDRTGVIYTNQTGGRGCSHPEMEGFYVPIVDTQVNLQQVLFNYFSGPKWNRWCTSSEGIDKETADYIDTVLKKSPLTQALQVDRNKLKESHEAWIRVILDKKKLGSNLPIVENLKKSWGILTWENSD